MLGSQDHQMNDCNNVNVIPCVHLNVADSMSKTLILCVVRAILRLFCGLEHTQTSIHLRLFVTSRPELPIRLGFSDMAEGIQYDVALHEVPRWTIERDIAHYLEYEFARIRADRSKTQPLYPLPPDWPGKESLHALVQRAVPLFIFAATICRFIADLRGNPKGRLDRVLKHREISKLD